MPLDQNVVAWTYTDDNGETYRLRAKKGLVDQVNGSSAVLVGGAAATVAVPLPPIGFRPRRAYIAGGTPQVIRSVVVYENGAPIMTGGTEILINHKGVEATFASTGGRLAESVRGGIVSST